MELPEIKKEGWDCVGLYMKFSGGECGDLDWFIGSCLTVKFVKDVFDKCGEVIDPHTATGVKAALKKADKGGYPVVTLATAHPAKFPEAIRESKVPEAELPKYLGGLMDAPERYEVLPNDIEAVKRFIAG
jgi:threonine synthase